MYDNRDKAAKKNQMIAAVMCSVLMIVLGMSDSLRGDSGGQAYLRRFLKKRSDFQIQKCR